ncbi:uncharacterized protein LOC102807591 [Saccoglossus kowalevskii]|uniref:Papilin-like n=1 Tax=Saccoglossus kowalevskii TaxID=10224 RepID=A0ABM0LY92_SACKO|nr:PREDICTED: papilin-like [Saccoglossus kowalevskii]
MDSEGRSQSGENDSYVEDAINAVLNNAEQTYDEFINAFTILTHEDANQYAPQGGDISNGRNLTNNGTLQSHQQSAVNVNSAQLTEPNNDDLQEEILDEGTIAPSILMRTSETTGGKILKVDNYVDDEGCSSLSSVSSDTENDDDVDLDSTYQPSSLTLNANTGDKGPSLQEDNKSASSNTELNYDADHRPELSGSVAETAQSSALICSDPRMISATDEKQSFTNANNSEDGISKMTSSLSAVGQGSIVDRESDESELEDSDGTAASCSEDKILPGEAEYIPLTPTEDEVTNRTLLEISTKIKHAAMVTDEEANIGSTNEVFLVDQSD